MNPTESTDALASVLLPKAFAAPHNPESDITYTSVVYRTHANGLSSEQSLSEAWQGAICSTSVHGAVLRIANNLGLNFAALYTASTPTGWDVYTTDDSLVGRVGVYSFPCERLYKHGFADYLANPDLDPLALA